MFGSTTLQICKGNISRNLGKTFLQRCGAQNVSSFFIIIIMVLHITTVKEDGEGISNLYIILSLQTSIKVAGNPSNTKCLILLPVQSFIAKPELMVSTSCYLYTRH